MPSRAPSPPRRKTAEARRAEIVAAASRIALADGLGSLTLRRVATTVDVFPGLINHYFPTVDELVAAAFAHAAGSEMEAIFAAVEGHPTPLARMRALLDQLVSEDRDAVSLLWLDAWQGCRHRPVLRAEVVGQMGTWQRRLAELVAGGAAMGTFEVADAGITAARILAAVDGLSVQAAVRSIVDYAVVRDMVVANIERELGLSVGQLGAGTE